MPITLARGGDGSAESVDGEVLTCVVSRAFAPGAPVDFTVRIGAGELTLGGKSLGSRRRDDGRFDVRFRLVNLRREDREALAATLPGRAPRSGR